ncbi:MAG: hypothetical protein F6K17_31930 [Okeania sp. SIO3C4]|nr:hypothetical protein [Okeania sp. SIO3B3]NER06864.1 hypothetical protein [Okeania sp. SIO3C4]
MKKAEGRRQKEEGRRQKAEGRRQKGKLLMDSLQHATPCLQTPSNFQHQK